MEFIPNPSYDLKSSILDSNLEYSTAIPTTDEFYKEGKHYETSKVSLKNVPSTCLHTLRLTKPEKSSYGYATVTEKQWILYGFETTFTLNIANAHLKWDKYVWINDIAHGIALVFQNQNVDLDTLSLDKDRGLGYGGLNDAVAVEFDFHITLDTEDPWKTHPGQPHLSVQYSNPLSPDSEYSLGMAWLPYNLTKNGLHEVKIEYVRAIEEENYLGDLSFTTYGESFLDFTTTTPWYSSYRLGLLKVFIDNMDRSILEMPINLGAIAGHDDLDVANPNTGVKDGSMAWKSWISLSSTTSDTTDQSAAFQIVEWNYKEHDKWRLSSAECLKARDLTGTKPLFKMKLRNIGKEQLFFKFIHKNTTTSEYILDQEYWADCFNRDGDVEEVYLDFTYFNGFLDGWDLELYIDDTIQDVVVHDHLNETFTSFNTYFQTIDNTEVYNDNEVICMRSNDDGIQLGFCGCRKWVEIFDLLEYYALGKQKYWKYKYLSNSRWYWFEASQTTTAAENLFYQDHPICQECVYDSQCSWFLPGGKWVLSPDNYVIGNPLEPTLTSYGFQDNIRDNGLVTDGIIKGPIWDCESARPRYTDTALNVESYNTFPDYQMPDVTQKGECIKCLRDSTKTEADWHGLCGNGVEIDVSTQHKFTLLGIHPSDWMGLSSMITQWRTLSTTDLGWQG